MLDDSDDEMYYGIIIVNDEKVKSTNVPVTNQLPTKNISLGDVSYTNLIKKITDIYQLI